jgi:hypothetical protein
VAVIVGVPATESEYDTEQDPLDRVHARDEPKLTPNEKVPVELEEVNVTVPVGELPETTA